MDDIKLILELDYTGYEDYLIKTNIMDSADGQNSSAWYTFKFPNGYAVIIGKAKYTKGYSLNRWQLDPMKYDPVEDELYYVSEDPVLTRKDLLRPRGSLTDKQVRKYLEEYKNL